MSGNSSNHADLHRTDDLSGAGSRAAQVITAAAKAAAPELANSLQPPPSEQQQPPSAERAEMEQVASHPHPSLEDEPPHAHTQSQSQPESVPEPVSEQQEGEVLAGNMPEAALPHVAPSHHPDMHTAAQDTPFTAAQPAAAGGRTGPGPVAEGLQEVPLNGAGGGGGVLLAPAAADIHAPTSGSGRMPRVLQVMKGAVMSGQVMVNNVLQGLSHPWGQTPKAPPGSTAAHASSGSTTVHSSQAGIGPQHRQASWLWTHDADGNDVTSRDQNQQQGHGGQQPSPQRSHSHYTMMDEEIEGLRMVGERARSYLGQVQHALRDTPDAAAEVAGSIMGRANYHHPSGSSPPGRDKRWLQPPASRMRSMPSTPGSAWGTATTITSPLPSPMSDADIAAARSSSQEPSSSAQPSPAGGSPTPFWRREGSQGSLSRGRSYSMNGGGSAEQRHTSSPPAAGAARRSGSGAVPEQDMDWWGSATAAAGAGPQGAGSAMLADGLRAAAHTVRHPQAAASETAGRIFGKDNYGHRQGSGRKA